MIITFRSKITQDGKVTNNIEFSAPLTLSDWDRFTVYEFKEPQAGEQNRIEVNEQEVNIFAGRNTINLKLNEPLAIEYATPGGNIILVSELLEMTLDDKKNASFKYTLANNGQIIGEYDIELVIGE